MQRHHGIIMLKPRCLFLLGIALGLDGSVQAVRIEECASGHVNVRENSLNYSLTCRDYTDTVTWSYTTARSAVILGTCSASSCTLRTGLPQFFSLTRLSESSSRLTVTYTLRESGSLRYGCGTSTAGSICQSDVIVPADVSSVDLTVLRAVSGWTLQGNVNISSVYSSLGRYSCSWIRRFQNGTESTVPDVRLTLSPDPSNTTNQQDREGSCSFTKNLPSTMGNVIYRVSVSPGNSESEQSIQIDGPRAPRVSCFPRPYVPEYTELRCTCSTQNVGKPEGRLMWYRGLGTNNLINSGTYGDNVLEMTPQVLTLSDHGVTQFRCDVDWAVDVTGAGYTADVGYPPSSTQLSISPPKLSENQAVTIDCQANGRPTPNMTLIRRDRGTVMSVELSPLSYTIPRSSCEDAGDYTCVASNSMGPDRENTDTMIVKCKPQTDRIPLSGVKVKLNDQPVTLSFDIRSYPAPDNFTFAYLGETSNTSTTRPLPQDIYLNAACVAKSSTPYEATCTVTVSRVSSRSAAGYFIMRVINSEGYQDYMFQIILDEEDENRSGTDSTSSVAIGLGVILAVLVLGVAVVVVWLWRRQWILPCAAREAATETTSRPLSTRDKSAPGKNLFEMPSTVPRAPAGPYDSLQMQDVGLRSPYAEIGHADDIEDTSAPYETPGIEPTNATPEEAEPAYENK